MGAKKQGMTHNLRYILSKKQLGCRGARQVKEYHSWWLKLSNGDVYIGRHCKHVTPSKDYSFFWVIRPMGSSRPELTLGIIIKYDFWTIPSLLMVVISAYWGPCLFLLWYWRPNIWYWRSSALCGTWMPRLFLTSQIQGQIFQDTHQTCWIHLLPLSLRCILFSKTLISWCLLSR